MWAADPRVAGPSAAWTFRATIRARESKAAAVQVVSKVLRILEALDSSSTGLRLREIAQQTRIHKTTAYRFLAHLENAG